MWLIFSVLGIMAFFEVPKVLILRVLACVLSVRLFC